MTASGIGYTAAVVVAAVFAVAAMAKLRDLRATADGFERLGIPQVELFARMVPVTELAVAVLLLIVPAGGAISALVTLAFFTTFLIGRLRAGVRAPCACFGASAGAPLSGIEIARNLGLMVLASTALATDRPVRPTLLDLLVVLVPTAVGAGVLHLLRSRREGTPATR
ncbi:MAG TPA: MauE/DoxX family redox-associated membrane protein [Acidimicrobiales bacterium]